jgi:hypothetical protein
MKLGDQDDFDCACINVGTTGLIVSAGESRVSRPLPFSPEARKSVADVERRSLFRRG